MCRRKEQEDGRKVTITTTMQALRVIKQKKNFNTICMIWQEKKEGKTTSTGKERKERKKERRKEGRIRSTCTQKEAKKGKERACAWSDRHYKERERETELMR